MIPVIVFCLVCIIVALGVGIVVQKKSDRAADNAAIARHTRELLRNGK